MQTPRIKYTLISRENIVLVEDYEGFGPFVDRIPNRILPLVKQVGKFMWTADDYNYMYVKQQNGLIVLTMFDKQFNKELAQTYIEKVEDEFLESCSEEEFNSAIKMQYLQFRDDIKVITKDYNQNYGDKLQNLYNENVDRKEVVVQDLNDIMNQKDSAKEQKNDDIMNYMEQNNKDQENEEVDYDVDVGDDQVIDVNQNNQEEVIINDQKDQQQESDADQFLNIVEKHEQQLHEKNRQNEVNDDKVYDVIQIQNNLEDQDDLFQENFKENLLPEKPKIQQKQQIDINKNDKEEPLIIKNDNIQNENSNSSKYKCITISTIILILLLIGVYIFFAIKCGYALNNCNFQLIF